MINKEREMTTEKLFEMANTMKKLLQDMEQEAMNMRDRVCQNLIVPLYDELKTVNPDLRLIPAQAVILDQMRQIHVTILDDLAGTDQNYEVGYHRGCRDVIHAMVKRLGVKGSE